MGKLSVCVLKAGTFSKSVWSCVLAFIIILMLRLLSVITLTLLETTAGCIALSIFYFHCLFCSGEAFDFYLLELYQ